MESPKPVIVADLFSEIHSELLNLLKNLSDNDWQKLTVCAGWSVKDVALHLLGDEIGNLSRRRDGVVSKDSIHHWTELVTFLNDWNQSWVSATRRMSPRVLIDLLELNGSQMVEYFQGLDPFSMGPAVGWVGSEPAPVWLDLAREYTERWHHQQHIRDAVARPDLKQPRFFSPVLETFVRALPRTYRAILAAEATSVTLSITGESGNRWTILRENDGWNLVTGAPAAPNAEVIMDQDIAWRLFTRGISQNQAQTQILFKGNQNLGLQMLEMVSIIA